MPHDLSAFERRSSLLLALSDRLSDEQIAWLYETSSPDLQTDTDADGAADEIMSLVETQQCVRAAEGDPTLGDVVSAYYKLQDALLAESGLDA